LHVAGRELEVEDMRVLGDAVAMRGLGDDWHAALDTPAQEDLGWASPEVVRDSRDHGVAEQCGGAERAAGLERDIPFGAGV
jgi:hypothetical protein